MEIEIVHNASDLVERHLGGVMAKQKGREIIHIIEASLDDAEGRDDGGSDRNDRRQSRSTSFDDNWLNCESDSLVNIPTGSSSSWSGSTDSLMGLLFPTLLTGPCAIGKNKCYGYENSKAYSFQSKSWSSMNGSDLDNRSCYDEQLEKNEPLDNLGKSKAYFFQSKSRSLRNGSASDKLSCDDKRSEEDKLPGNVGCFASKGAEPGEVDESNSIDINVDDHVLVDMSLHPKPDELRIAPRQNFTIITPENGKREAVEDAKIGIVSEVATPISLRVEGNYERGSKRSKKTKRSGPERSKKTKGVDAKTKNDAPNFLYPFVPSSQAKKPHFDRVTEYINIAEDSHTTVDDGTKDVGPIVNEEISIHINVNDGAKDVCPIADRETSTVTASGGFADSAGLATLGAAASTVYSSTGRNVETAVNGVDELLKATEDVTSQEGNYIEDIEALLNIHEHFGVQVEVLRSKNTSDFLNKKKNAFVLPEDAEGLVCKQNDPIDTTLLDVFPLITYDGPSIATTKSCTQLASAAPEERQSKEFRVETGGDSADDLFKAAADIADAAADLCGYMDEQILQMLLPICAEHRGVEREKMANQPERRKDEDLLRSITSESCGGKDEETSYVGSETSFIENEKEAVSAIQEEKPVKSPKRLATQLLPGIFTERKEFGLKQGNATDQNIDEYRDVKREKMANRTKLRKVKDLLRSINGKSLGIDVMAGSKVTLFVGGTASAVKEEKEDVIVLQVEQPVESRKSLDTLLLPGIFTKRKKIVHKKGNANDQHVDECRGVKREKMANRTKRRKVKDLLRSINSESRGIDVMAGSKKTLFAGGKASAVKEEIEDVSIFHEKMANQPARRKDEDLPRTIDNESCCDQDEETSYVGGETSFIEEEKEDVSAIQEKHQVKSPKNLAVKSLPGIFATRKKFGCSKGNETEIIDEDMLMTFILNAIKLEQENHNELLCQSENDFPDGFLDLINDAIEEELLFSHVDDHII